MIYSVLKHGERYHVVYTIPNSDSFSSVVDCRNEISAKRIACSMNRSWEQSQQQYVDPYDRRIPSGFYSDNDAE